jgi:hypothetical protein
MRDAIESYGGKVEKFIGDAVVGVFGSEAAHEDDAAGAVLAADEMRRRLASLNDTLPADWGVISRRTKAVWRDALSKSTDPGRGSPSTRSTGRPLCARPTTDFRCGMIGPADLRRRGWRVDAWSPWSTCLSPVRYWVVSCCFARCPAVAVDSQREQRGWWTWGRGRRGLSRSGLAIEVPTRSGRGRRRCLGTVGSSPLTLKDPCSPGFMATRSTFATSLAIRPS